MFDFTADMTVEEGGADAIKAALEALSQTEVLVGIPEEEAGRDGDELTNVELMYIQSNGSPLVGIPPRPVIEPALEDSSERIAGLLREASLKASDGDQSVAMAVLEKAGMAGMNAARDWFANPKNNWPANAPAVQRLKERKGSNIPMPLIDTGELRRSITYVMRTEP